MGQNLTILMRIKAHKKEMTTTPLIGDRMPKKATLHRTLTISWAAKKLSAILAAKLLGVSLQIRNREMPIRVKSTIQINSIYNPDGAKDGFTRVGYQLATELAVNIDPRTPAI
jgi:hypothetical protein